MTSHLFLSQELLNDLPSQGVWAVAHMRWLHVHEGQLRGIVRDSLSRDFLFELPLQEIDKVSFRGVLMSV